MISELELAPWAILRPQSGSHWEAYCPDVDLTVLGEDPEDALDTLVTAIASAVVSDLQGGTDPATRRAPEAQWQELWGLIQAAERLPLEEVLKTATATTRAFAVHFRIRFTRHPPDVKELESAAMAFLLRKGAASVEA